MPEQINGSPLSQAGEGLGERGGKRMDTLSPVPSPTSGRGELLRWLSLSALVIVLDQLSKAWITNHFALGENLYVLSVFNLVLAHNTGAAFSFLNDAGGMQRWLFSIIAITASIWIVWLLRKHAAQTLFAFALSLILGGALGNLIDRIVYGYVVDFLSFHWDTHFFPAFNLADSAITCGAALLILESFIGKRHGTVTG
jgi:signal peptidase II